MLIPGLTEEHYETQFSIVTKVGNTKHQVLSSILEDKGSNRPCQCKEIVQTMDDGVLLAFLSLRCFMVMEKTFHSLEQLEQAIVDYID